VGLAEGGEKNDRAGSKDSPRELAGKRKEKSVDTAGRMTGENMA